MFLKKLQMESCWGREEKKENSLNWAKKLLKKKLKENYKKIPRAGNIRVSVKNPVEIPSPVSLEKKQVSEE